MAPKELEASDVAEEKYQQVKKELKELKKAIDKSEKLIKLQEAKRAKNTAIPEAKELFIERKDKGKKAATDENFDISPGDHVLVKL